MATHEIRIDRSKTLLEEPGTGHNRWHPDIPPVLRCEPGDEVVLETRDAFDGQMGPDATLETVAAPNLDVVHPLTGPVFISGAEPGDVLALTGRQGWAAGGLAVLGRGFRSPRVLVEAYRRPEPPYAAGLVAAEAGATSMIDISDGLLAEARHLADASGVAIDVRRDSFDVPEPLVAVGGALGADPLGFILGGGDDHALLATFPEGSVPDGWQVIGSVAEGSGVTVDGGEYDGPTGWTHF